jgi:excinuclease ABC subunit A
MKKLIIRGAREHNLKNINLDLDRDKLIVISGISGSGKSSLAFDTIFAEGQRRYVESLSSYARMFLGRLEKPDVDYIEGLSPAIAIEQKTTHKNPRSTVGTVTEIYDYYRLLWARIGRPHCPICGREIQEQSIDQIIEHVFEKPEGARLMIAAPVVRGKKGEHRKVFEDAVNAGFTRMKIDGEMVEISDSVPLDKKKKHDIDIIVDRIVLREDNRKRLADSLETAMEITDGLVTVIDADSAEANTYSEKNSCTECGISIPELQPRLFSFNNPYGACPDCHGIGVKSEFDPQLIIPDLTLSFNQGAVATANPDAAWNRTQFAALAEHFGFTLDTPFADISPRVRDKLLYGTNARIHMVYTNERNNGKYEFDKKYGGIIADLKRRYAETQSPGIKQWLEGFMKVRKCETCGGNRLRSESMAVLLNGTNIIAASRLSVKEALKFFDALSLSPSETAVSSQILREILARLRFLRNVGLDYLTLERAAGTLSGGEAQRIRLATQIGSALSGVLYVLDEPSIGLHQRDNQRLIETLKELRDIGNTLIVVEHDEAMLRQADYLVDLGPGAGIHGGSITACGTPEEVQKVPESITGSYLSGRLSIDTPTVRRKGSGYYLKLIGARRNNLKDITVSIPLGVLTVITGVSGSGKSTLLNELLYPAVTGQIGRGAGKKSLPEGLYGIEGSDYIDKTINIDQSPIGRTPRSNPATYIGAFTPIRELFSSLPESKARGYKPGRFSFNVKGGRCEHCQGDGTLKIEMHFLPDVYVTCDVCGGKRFNNETLQVRYKGKNIHDVLSMGVEEAAEFFAPLPQISRKLETLKSVGLEYIKLGQSALTLSGGEAQRVKLSLELSKRSTGRTLYILDEPTTGLHFADVKKLMEVVHRLVEGGNTVLMIEHNLDVIKSADHLIDLGPEGGDGGGFLVAEGTPEQVARSDRSYTGQFLRNMLI